MTRKTAKEATLPLTFRFHFHESFAAGVRIAEDDFVEMVGLEHRPELANEILAKIPLKFRKEAEAEARQAAIEEFAAIEEAGR